ncbi:MAG TPA: M48 family metallopeptidase [Candidatus Angelobacter sp.]
MRFRAFLLSTVCAAGMGLPVSAFGQDNSPKPAPDAAPAQSPPTQPAGDQTQAPPAASQDQAQAADEQDQAKNPEVKHDGGKKDVDAIGQRKLGGFDIYSIDTDVKIGRAYAQQIEPHMKMVEDPVVNEYVNRIGQNLVRNSDAKFPFTIKVVADDDINAMALPGGILYVNSGLILAAEDEAELAGAMAHEIAHVALRHATRAQTRMEMARIMTIPLIAIGGPISLAGMEAARLGVPITFLMFSRDFEAEADYFGVQYMYKAGYDPNALVNFFEKIQAREKRKPGTVSKVFATHPQTPDRIRKSQKEIATILPARDNYVETTSEFNDVKGRLAALEHRRKAVDPSPDRPVLRRIASHMSENGRDTKDNDHPAASQFEQ